MALVNSFLSASILILSILTSNSNAIISINGTYGGLHPRLEIRQMFRTNPNQFNLYLLALQQFQSNKQDFITSWYQIGGIHGAPNIPWDGVVGNGGGVGYCTHSSNLFPTWHRPYIALFEMKLQTAALYKAQQFPAGPTQQMYIQLASTLRAPFWDWAAAPINGNPSFPLVVSQKYVTVQSPTGAQTIINPLFRYQFNPVSPNQVAPYGAPWNTWSVTFRYPTSSGGQGVTSQNNLATATLNNNRISQMQSLYNWFTLCPEYDQISNDQASGSSPSCHISLESLHNNVHVWVGGGNNGHMTIVPVSAWDPTFMLHHAMIDRLFAMWQTLYPNSYISDEPFPVSTYYVSQGTTQGGDSPLAPFHKDSAGDFWTSNDVRDWTVFGYTYPEFSDSDGSAGSIMQYVNNLYGPNANAGAGSSKHKRDVPLSATTAANGSTYQYIANIQTTRFQLDGSYLIYLFFGNPVSEDPQTWGTAPNMVGSYGVFSTPGMTGSSLTTTSTVPLTEALTACVGNGLLRSLESLFVVAYLESELNWRVAKTDGTVIDPADIPDFLISVVSSTMTTPSSADEFPTWSPFNVLAQITANKPGGLALLGELSLLGRK